MKPRYEAPQTLESHSLGRSDLAGPRPVRTERSGNGAADSYGAFGRTPGPGSAAEEARKDDAGMTESEGVYIISVAARLLNMHPQTLRKYERAGFISPSRTIGMLRLYSAQDIARLRLIRYLVEEIGLNLAGVELVLGRGSRLLTLDQALAVAHDDREARQRSVAVVHEILEGLGLRSGRP